MQLYIEKIGKIKNATIDINGLTVIAGKNDTGKSTVGKTLYSIFRALEMYKYYIDQRLLLHMESQFFRPLLKKYTALDFSSELGQRCDQLLVELRDSSETDKIQKGILTYSKMRSIALQIKDKAIQDKEIQKLVDEILQELELLTTMSLSEKFRRTLAATLRTMFVKFINNSKYLERAQISIINGSRRLLDVSIEQDRIVSDMFVFDEAAPFPFSDILYSESPFVLENMLTFYKPNWSELQEKIDNVKRDPSKDDGYNSELIDFIQREILGNSIISLDEKEHEFRYQVDLESVKLPMADAACGIRAFALLFVLLKYNVLTRDILLVLDEPENHLHPEWQIKYAEIVALLVKEGFSVMLTSHSPTFIQALYAYSRKYEIAEKTKFYLAEQVQNENYSSLTDVSTQVERITENLVEPMDKLFLEV